MRATSRGPIAPAAGVAAGVPYVALPPAAPARRTPLVVAWPGLEAPRGERALSAALPLTRLPAWRVYLRLPESGGRAPSVSPEPELPPLGTDAVRQEGLVPVVEQAVAELPAVVAALRTRLPGAEGPVGLFGWSAGAMVALLAVVERTLPVPAMVLVHPVVQLERLVEVDPRRGEPAHQPAAAAHSMAERFDFLARASEIAGRDPQPAVLMAVAVREDPPIGGPAERLWRALADRYAVPSRVALLLTPELAPRCTELAQVDTAVTDWFARHLTERARAGTTMD